MKVNLSGWYVGRIALDDRIIDLTENEIRPRITEPELRGYHDECIKKLETFANHFEDVKAFEKTLEEIKGPKRVNLVARDAHYPGLFNTKHLDKSIESLFNPEKIEDVSKFFYSSQYIAIIPTKNNPFVVFYDDPEKAMNKISQEECKRQGLPKIEIPNDRTRAEAKGSTFHETLHHVIVNYQINSGRLITKEGGWKTKEDRRAAESLMQEDIVMYLTDILLEDDKDALFEQRWQLHELNHPGAEIIIDLAMLLPAAYIVGTNIMNPKWIPLALIPLATKPYAYGKYKKSKKEEFTKPMEKAEFKI
jgi:hypothetical protein